MHHLAGAHQHDVTRLDGDLGEFARCVEVAGTDGVARREHVVPEGAGDVEQDAPADDRGEPVDATACGTVGGDGRGRVAVVDHAAVTAVGERVPVGGALRGQGEDVLAEADPIGLLRVHREVDLDHGAGRIDPALDESGLDPLRLRQGQPEREGPAGHHRRRAAASCLVIDEVEGADLVVGPPPPPVAHPGGHVGEHGGDGHAGTLAPARLSPAERAAMSEPGRLAI